MNGLSFGAVHKIYRPATFHIWIWALRALAPLALIGLVLLISIDTPDPVAEVRSNAVCLGGLALVAAALGAVFVSDFRKWKAARSLRLTLYTNGLVFESSGNTACCLWHEIQDIRYKQIRSTSRAFPGNSIRVIGSIVKNDGTAFVLPEVLPLPAITDDISRLRKSSQQN